MSTVEAWVLLSLCLLLVGFAFTFGVLRILRRTSDVAELGGKPRRKVLVTIKVRYAGGARSVQQAYTRCCADHAQLFASVLCTCCFQSEVAC